MAQWGDRPRTGRGPARQKVARLMDDLTADGPVAGELVTETLDYDGGPRTAAGYGERNSR